MGLINDVQGYFQILRSLSRWYFLIHLEMPSEAVKTILGSFQSFLDIIDEPQCIVKHLSW